MNKTLLATSLSFLISIFIKEIVQAQIPDWRIGFEYYELPPPFTSEANHDTLLSRLAFVTNAQQTSCINTNGNGWQAMQPTETSSINFNEFDGWISRFQDAGMEYMFYLTPNTEWSHLNNTNCANGPGDDECAPDSTHWQNWIDYVKAIVERYDGDGSNDLIGLQKPVRFYVMPQEVTFAGQGGGTQDDIDGVGYWDDNMQNLIELHRVTYEAMQNADPSGNSKLVGSGGWFIDLYGDFPDYPAIEGPIVSARLNGQNLFGSNYQASFDSMKILLQGLADTTGGKKCDYIGWHPHSGWKSTIQSFDFIHTYAPGYPIFVDDMWSSMLTSWDGFLFIYKNGYCQFIGGDSLEGDFPTATISSYQQLFAELDNGTQSTIDWYNAKTAREVVKNFAMAFGEGAERVVFSLTNDVNPDNITYGISQPFRYTGMVERKNNGFAPKPVMYTMRLLTDQIFDFTSATELSVSLDPRTRVYKFYRDRGTSCYVAWSEAGWNTETPEIPNGEIVSIPVLSDTLTLYNIITENGVTQPATSDLIATGGMISLQLGFEPVIIEEHNLETGIGISINEPSTISAFPNPTPGTLIIQFHLPSNSDVILEVFDMMGRKVWCEALHQLGQGNHRYSVDLTSFPNGLYLIHLFNGNKYATICVDKQ